MRKANLILHWRDDHANIGDCACCVIRWVIDSESKSRKCNLDVHHPAYILVGERAVDHWDFPARGQHHSARGTLAIVLQEIPGLLTFDKQRCASKRFASTFYPRRQRGVPAKGQAAVGAAQRAYGKIFSKIFAYVAVSPPKNLRFFF
jgi:hypothetical protein